MMLALLSQQFHFSSSIVICFLLSYTENSIIVFSFVDAEAIAEHTDSGALRGRREGLQEGFYGKEEKQQKETPTILGAGTR